MSRALAALCVLLPMAAQAHAVGLSQGRWETRADGIDAELTFSRSELEPLGMNAQALLELVDAEGCRLSRADASAAEREGVTLRGQWSCRDVPKQVTLRLFDVLPAGHRHLVAQQVLHRGEPVLALSAAPRRPFLATVALGLEHILTGWDHLLFLFGMVLVAARARALVKVVTAFTVAHSVTLAMSVLGVFAPSPRWVEPLIALSIAYVGIENLLVANLDKRWRIAFGFGLLHGFGFAGGLQDIGASGPSLPWALLGFNLGVEAGQLAVLALLLPMLALVRRSSGRWNILKPALSALVVLPGLVWFAQRVAEP